jgi:hypothetical protein
MRLAGKDEEDRLEGVLGVVGVAQGAPAGGQYHRSVPADELPERAVAARGLERPEQGRVRQ